VDCVKRAKSLLEEGPLGVGYRFVCTEGAEHLFEVSGGGRTGLRPCEQLVLLVHDRTSVVAYGGGHL
jgi:hypothetical protein